MSHDAGDRIEHAGLRRKVVPAPIAVTGIQDGDIVAVSGFTKSGEPKACLEALARTFEARTPAPKITLYSGASLSDAVETPLSPFIARRGPYMSCAATRRLIHDGKIDFADVHLSAFARNLHWGFYGEIDTAIVEVCRILPDASVVLTSSVGISCEALARAKRVILEVNTLSPDYLGFHDLLLPAVPPRVGWPIPITHVRDRVGMPTFAVDPEKVAAVVVSARPDHGVPFRPPGPVEQAIAANVVDYLDGCRKRYGWNDWLPPLQSGVGNIANAVIGELRHAPFRQIRFWTEVFQDGMLAYLDDRDRFDGASSTAFSFSESAGTAFLAAFDACRERVVLRPMWLSNAAEVITRLFVIAMNTPLEVDIYGHVNSTHIRGSRIVNGLGGSGDFLRNAYLGVVHTPSVRRLSNGRVVSCVMPYLEHVDHTEHDVRAIVTEQGIAVTTEIRSARHRAELVIDRCAHPHFRPLLRDYVAHAGGGDEPHTTALDTLAGWWRDYDAACASFPGNVAAG